MQAIPFFDDQITISVHTATRQGVVGASLSVAQFASGQPVSLYRLDNGELKVVKVVGGDDPGRVFIEGPEVAPAY